MSALLTYPGQFLTWVRGLLNSSRPSMCDRWGCFLKTGKDSMWGPGPTCEVCQYGLRHSAMPRRDER